MFVGRMILQLEQSEESIRIQETIVQLAYGGFSGHGADTCDAVETSFLKEMVENGIDTEMFYQGNSLFGVSNPQNVSRPESFPNEEGMENMRIKIDAMNPELGVTICEPNSMAVKGVKPVPIIKLDKLGWSAHDNQIMAGNPRENIRPDKLHIL